MKKEILSRAMFSKPMSKSARNTGIMAGFEDDMEEELAAEEMPPMARTPQNPEILMNNLRGDIRSVDARYLELAQMVGEEAASETPPEVLAMLQTQLAAQQAPPTPPAGGIGSLAPADQMAGGQMMPPGMEGSAPMMPPGMEGGSPFPQGGAEQAPPTPDGMPPLRAAEGQFVTQEARRQQMNSPLFIPEMGRFNELTSGRVPPEEMTPQEQEFLRTYQFGMGFTGGTIRDIAKEGASRIGSALSPYVSRGMNYLDELVTPFTRPTMRVERQVVPGTTLRPIVRGEQNINQGARGAEMGSGTKLEAANTLGVGRIPFSQAMREDPLLGRALDFARQNPKTTMAGTGTAAATLAAMNQRGTLPPAKDSMVDQIPGQGPPLYGPKGERLIPPGRENEPWEVNFVDRTREPEVITEEAETPAADPTKPPLIPPPEVKDTKEGSFDQGILDLINKTFSEKTPASTKTRAERIKEEYEAIEPTFRELLGDTKSDARTNALLLLADAGFKFASTYKPTMAMALGEAMSGVPKGFANIVAQARANNIKIKSAALEQAMGSINMQDKVARDYQLKQLDVNGRLITQAMKDRSGRELEQLKQSGKIKELFITNDFNLMLEELKAGQLVDEDGGLGLINRKSKSGSYRGSYINTADPVVQEIVGSRYTLQETSPYVTNRGPAPTFSVRNTEQRNKLGSSIQSFDNTLRLIDDLETEVNKLYTMGTWVKDKVNNIFVPITGGGIRPDVDLAAAKIRIGAGLTQIVKQLAAANDQGRVAVYEQQVVEKLLGDLNKPTAFFTNPELAAAELASLKTSIYNSRQQGVTQLGFVKDDLTMSVPALGTKNSPFVIPADPQGKQGMRLYLQSIFKNIPNPRPDAKVFIQDANGVVESISVTELGKL